MGKLYYKSQVVSVCGEMPTFMVGFPRWRSLRGHRHLLLVVRAQGPGQVTLALGVRLCGDLDSRVSVGVVQVALEYAVFVLSRVAGLRSGLLVVGAVVVVGGVFGVLRPLCGHVCVCVCVAEGGGGPHLTVLAVLATLCWLCGVYGLGQ